MRPPARSLPCLALVLATLPGLAGCGGDDDAPAPAAPASEEASGTPASAEVLRRAAAATVRVEGARVAVQQRIVVDGNPVTATGEGIATERLRRSRVTVDADLSRLPGAERDFGKGAKVEQDVRRDGATLYLNSAQLARLLPSSRPWLRIAPSDLAQKAVVDLSSVTSATAGLDPAQGVRYLRSAATGVRKLGEETVRGEPTTHYRATLDLRRALRDVPDAARPALRQTIKATGTKTIPTDVWIGNDGRIRRLKQVIGATFGGQVVKAQSTIELYAFGPQEAVRLPSEQRTVGLVEAFPYAFDRGN